MACVRLLKRGWRDESGNHLVEYALIAALVIAGTIALFPGITTRMGNAFSTWGTNVETIWIPYCPGSTTTYCP